MANNPSDATIKRAAHGKANPYYLSLRETAQDVGISYQALGLLTYLLSLPDDWEVRVKTLVRTVKKNGRDFVYSAIKELCDAGYMSPRRKYRNDKGQWVWTPYYVHESPFAPGPQTAQPYTGQPDTAKAEIKTTEDTVTDSIQTEEVVVVPLTAAEAAEIVLTAETPQPQAADALREGTDAEPATPIPGSAAPLSPDADALIKALGLAKVSRTLALELIEAYGLGRVTAVWQYVQDNAATLRKPVAFLRSELADPRYVPLDASMPVVVAAPNTRTDNDAASERDEDDSTPDRWVTDPSIKTVVKGGLIAESVWSLAVSQLMAKGFRDIRSAQDVPLAAYDPSTQTYTVRVVNAHLQQQLGSRYGKVVQHTLQGLHEGATVKFVTKDTPLAIPAAAEMKG